MLADAWRHAYAGVGYDYRNPGAVEMERNRDFPTLRGEFDRIAEHVEPHLHHEIFIAIVAQLVQINIEA
ncbi:hypothetical protein D3C73_1398130 [compost metagenome]